MRGKPVTLVGNDVRGQLKHLFGCVDRALIIPVRSGHLGLAQHQRHSALVIHADIGCFPLQPHMQQRFAWAGTDRVVMTQHAVADPVGSGATADDLLSASSGLISSSRIPCGGMRKDVFQDTAKAVRRSRRPYRLIRDGSREAILA